MGSKGGGNAPTPPDYASIIPIQEQSNMNQFGSMLNSSRVDSTTPYGTTTWQRPDTPDGTWQVNQQLDPSQQYLYDQDLRIRAGQGGIAEGMLGNVADVYNQPVNFAGQLPGYQQVGRPEYQAPETFYSPQYQRGPDYQGPMGFDAPQYQGPGQFTSPEFKGPTSAPEWNTAYDTRDKAEQAYYNRSLRYMYPDWQNRENSLHDRMAAQGFNVSDAAYGDQMATLSNQRDKAMADARDAAIQFGGQEATGELNRGLMANQNQQQLSDLWFRNQLNGANTAWQNNFQGGNAAFQNQLAGLRSAFDSQLAGSNAYFRNNLDANNMAFQNQLAGANTQWQNQLAGANAAFNAGLQGSQFDQGEANRALQWAMQNIGLQQQDRARTLNELNSFRTGQQINLPGMSPQFSTPNLQGIDQLGLANQNYQNQLGAWNAEQASSDNFMSGLFGLGGALLGGPAGSFGGQLAGKIFGK